MKIMQEQGLTELIPEDSYVNTANYRSLYNQHREALKRFSELKDEVNSIPVQYKPQEEWSDLEQFMFDEFGDKPRIKDSEDVAKLKSQLSVQKELCDTLESKLKLLWKHAKSQRRQTREYKLPSPTKRRQFEGFSTATTGMSYYNDFLHDDTLEYMRTHKGLDGYIAEMSPKEYLECCADIFDSTFENQIYSTFREDIEKYAEKMKSGIKFNMPVLNYADNQQEGRHRAQAAYLAGIKIIPVLVVKNK